MRTSRLTADTLVPAADLVARSLRERARTSPLALDDPLPGTDHDVAERLLSALLDRDDPTLVATDRGRVVGVLGAQVHATTPDDLEHTYQPAHHVLAPLSQWHLDPAHPAAVPALWDALLTETRTSGATRRGVQAFAVDTVSTSRWARLGLRPDRTLAVRETLALPRHSEGARAEPSAPGPATPGTLTVRPPTDADHDILVDLVLAEISHHAHETGCGTSPQQSRATVARAVQDWAPEDAPETLERALVAELDGAVVGVCTVHVLEVDDLSPARYVLPARLGYVGILSVAEAARGRGVGAVLSDAVHGWLAARPAPPRTTALAVVADNPVAVPFWSRQGYTALTTVLTDAPSLATSRSAR